MELQAPLPMENNSTVDTSRVFSSVKEAVAIFGEKILSGELYSSPSVFTVSTPKQDLSPLWFSPMPGSSSSKSSPIRMKTENGEQHLMETLRRIESELEETKKELKQLKQRESETEVALASLNAELHKNMSKIAQSEANAAARARTDSLREGERKRNLAVKMDVGSPTLAQILGLGEKNREIDLRKKQPVVPILTHMFSRKKDGANASLRSSLFESNQVYLN